MFNDLGHSHATRFSNYSTATSTRTEDREELRKLFNSAVDTVEETPGLNCQVKFEEDERLAQSNDAESPTIIGKLRKRLSRSGTKSLAPLKSDAEPQPVSNPHKLADKHSLDSKKGLRKNFLTDDNLENGGYDSDAKSVIIGESLLSTREGDFVNCPVGGRKIPRRSPLQDLEWRTRSMTS